MGAGPTPERDIAIPSCAGSANPRPIDVNDRQDVMDAAAVVQQRRAELAADLEHGSVRGVEVTARGLVAINEWAA